MKFFCSLLLLFGVITTPAHAQSPPEARPFSTEQQGRSLSELSARPSSKATPPPAAGPGEGGEKGEKGVIAPGRRVESDFTSLDRLTRAPKAPKPPDAKTPDGRQPKVEIWLPPEFQSSERKWPVILFSHGFGGCARQSEFLTRHLADHGYIVLAPEHADANCEKYAARGGMRAGRAAAWPEKPFRTPAVWTDETEADRRDDVLFALASMLDDRQYRNYVDLDMVGLMGHSLGGYTVLGLAGAWPGWKDARFKAVMALSPFVGPYLAARTLGGIDAPVMYQGGTRDAEITPLLKKSGGAYAATPAPKYLLELDGAGHFAWTELERKHRAIIEDSTLAFFDKYLKDSGTALQFEAGKRLVRTFWADESVVPKRK